MNSHGGQGNEPAISFHDIVSFDLSHRGNKKPAGWTKNRCTLAQTVGVYVTVQSTWLFHFIPSVLHCIGTLL